MIQIKGAIFDMDGTLLDSMPAWVNAGQNYLLSLGFQPPDDIRNILRPLSLVQSAEYLRSAFGLNLSDQDIINGINKTVEDQYFHHVQPKKYVREFLEQLKNNSIPMCVATATDRYLTEAALSRTGLLNYFQFIITVTEVGISKSQPAIFEHALQKLGTPKNATVVFEDAVHAIRSAKSAGFPVVAVHDLEAEPETKMIKQLSNHYTLQLNLHVNGGYLNV